MIVPTTVPESSLLLTLEEISQLVSHSHHPGDTLANIVHLIQGRFHTDVCSVYLFEPDQGELVLGATVGLKPESVGRVRMRFQEGLTGLVAEKMTPVMVSDAFSHPRFKFFPESGEEPYHSFLGVPLIEGGVLQGVLVVQTREPRTFSTNETRMLVAVAAQLAPLVSEARLLEQVVAAAHQRAETPVTGKEPAVLHGTPLSPGIGVGEAYHVNGFEDWPFPASKRASDGAAEMERLAFAMEAARSEIAQLSQHISSLVGEDHGAILQGQLMIMQDSTIEDDLRDCMARGATAEQALVQTLQKYVSAFQKITNPFFQERVYDIKDVFRRILWRLRPQSRSRSAGNEKLILIAREASVMDLFSVDLDALAGMVVEQGGPQSHAAILARSLGIPMVGRVVDLAHRIQPGRRLQVDGSSGHILLDPPAGATSRLLKRPDGVSTQPSAPAASDGHGPAPRLEANVNLLCEVADAVRQGTGGVGLFRTEFLFLARRTLPTEEEQVRIYRKLLEQLGGRPASIRTFDLRPDKLPQHSHLHLAASYPLDWRLVLESPPLQKLFRDQVRAILRAAVAGPARILVPLVTHSEQLDFVLETLGQARRELAREGLEFAASVPLGIMIEVAAATAMAESWARQVDFFALGTNDLAASALGTDRQDPVGALDPLHPGFLRMVRDFVQAAHRAGRPVAVCGELASDPEGALVLLGLQIDSLSVAVHQLQRVQQMLTGQLASRWAELAPEFLRLDSARQIRDFIIRNA
jgi:phosphotransferase system enzyme I (PtsP)